MLRWMEYPLENFRKDLVFCFCLSEEDQKKLSVMHPPERFGDLSTNLLKIVDMTWFRRLFPTDEDIIWTVKAYGAPAEKVEIVNGMINVWLRQDLLIASMHENVEYHQDKELYEWLNIALVRHGILIDKYDIK